MSAETRLRLRGLVAEVERSWPLGPGVVLVGSSRTCGVVLPVRGVSRRHARLRVGETWVEVEDLGSVNGTACRGRAITSGRLAVGDEVRFGPVRLRLERVAADEVALGLALGSDGDGDATESSAASARTSTVRDDEGGAMTSNAELRLLAGLVERLAVRPAAAPDLAGVLATLADGCARPGAVVVAWEAEAPVVLASWGKSPAIPRRPPSGGEAELLLLTETEDAPDGRMTEGPGSVEGVVWRRPRATPIGLLLASPDPSASSPKPSMRLLGATLQLVAARTAQRLDALEAATGRQRTSDGEAMAVEAMGILEAPPGIVLGRAPEMLALYRRLHAAAAGELPILIVGETGTGKEHLARMVHAASAQADGPFVAVHCGAIPESLLEAEMFGVAAGVATGVTARPGALRRADGGTLFLDEIGDMSAPLQMKLLRALQEREVTPVGAPPVPVDVRFVSATHCDLATAASNGTFRADLFYRLAGVELEVPPLRRRGDDLGALLGTFLERACAHQGKRIPGVTVKALERLQAHCWPGNVRELEHEAQRLVQECSDDQAIDAGMLSPRIAALPDESERVDDEPERGLGAAIEDLERRMIRRALWRTGGNRSRAARLLQVSRTGLLKRLTRLGLDDESFSL
ncbi:MAG: sigma 54-interacting transcriptional regulator [Acidobacteriota bacterium]